MSNNSNNPYNYSFIFKYIIIGDMGVGKYEIFFLIFYFLKMCFMVFRRGLVILTRIMGLLSTLFFPIPRIF